MSDVDRVIEKVINIPTIPAVIAKMNRMLLNPRVSAHDIAQLISSDPTLATRILRIVNSAFYGFPSRIASVTHAIVILGFNTVRNIALSASLFEMFKVKENSYFNLTDFWRHCICTASFAKVIGKMLNLPTIEEVFIAGLTHDIGKLVESQYINKKFEKAVSLAYLEGILLYEAEGKILGMDHCVVGKALFEKWELPKLLIDVVSFHHQPELAPEDTYLAVAIVHVANILSQAILVGKSGNNKIPLVSEKAWERIGLKNEELEDLLINAYDEYEKATVFLELAKIK